MHAAMLWTVVGGGLALAVLGAVMSGLNRIVDRVLLAAVALVELATVAQSVIAGVELARGHHVLSVATVIGYLAGTALVLPIAVIWAWADKNRWAGMVVALGGLTVAVMTARLQMLWLGRA